MSKTKYFLKVINPKPGTCTYINDLVDEFCLEFKRYWQKKDNPEEKLYNEPVYPQYFDYIVNMYSYDLKVMELIKYLIQEYINKVAALDDIYYLEEIS